MVTGDVSPLGLPFSAFSGPTIDDRGRVVFRASSSAIFRRTEAGIVHVLAAGDVLPRGETLAGVGKPALMADGCVVAVGMFVRGGSALIRTCDGVVEYLGDLGDEAPGGGTITAFQPNVFVSTGGHIAFRARLHDGRDVLLRRLGSEVVSIARTGDTSFEGGEISSLRLVGVSARGRVGFRVAVSGGRDGLFWSDGTTRGRIAVEGEVTPAGGLYGRIAGATMNADDGWAFRADRDTGDAGVFRVDASGALPAVHTVVLEGDETQRPGVSIRQLPSSLEPSINAAGAIAFRASLSGGDGGSGVFLAPVFGPPVQIVQTQEETAVGALVRLRDPVLADDGSVVVPASITGLGPGLFVYRDGEVSELAQVGDQTDLDRASERFRFLTPVATTTAEGAVFAGQQQGIFQWSPGEGVVPLAFVGGPTPVGGIYAGLEVPAAGGQGVVAFVTEVREGRAARALVSTTGKDIASVVAATGRRAPGGGTLIDFFTDAIIDDLERPDVGKGGRIAFEATIQGARAGRGLFVKKGRRIRSAAREDQRVQGAVLDAFARPAIAGSATAFVSRLAETGAPLGFFVKKGRRPRMLAREGNRAPGRLDARFSAFGVPKGGPRSMFAVPAQLDGGHLEGVYLARKRQLGLLVGSGDLAPNGGAFRTFEETVFGAGAVVFRAQLVGESEAPSLYRGSATSVPAPADEPRPVERVVATGSASPVGGTFAAFTELAANSEGALAFTADIVGGTAQSGVFLVPDGARPPLP